MSVTEFFEIRVASVLTERPLAFDLYLGVAGKPVLFRKLGDVLTRERVKILFRHGGEKFLIRTNQRALYLQSLREASHNPECTPEEKGRLLKETAFVHVNDLFTKKDISPVVTEAHSLVEEMVNFMSADINATATLMRLSTHDYYTYNHCVDVSVYSIVLARRVFGESNKNLLIAAGLAGLLHDIGKRKVDTAIINKSSALTKDEWNEIKRHPEYGRNFLEGVPNVPDRIKLTVFEHHENYDGTGYPRGLQGDQISGLARVVMIADVFDALTTDRSYHKAVNPVEAMNLMFGMQPGKFDPDIFHSFDRKIKKEKSIKFAHNFDPCQPRRVFK